MEWGAISWFIFTANLNQHTAVASTNLSNWSGTCYLMPLLGAFLADAYFGRYWTIVSFSIIYVIGMTLLTLSGSVPGLKPNCRTKDSCIATKGQTAFCFTSLYLVPLGTGGIKPCVSSFGADQFDDTDELRKITKPLSLIGSILASTLVLWLLLPSLFGFKEPSDGDGGSVYLLLPWL